MKKLMLGAVCAMMAAVTFAEPSVEITEAYQEVPGSGIVNYTYTVKDLGGLTYDLYIKVGAKGCDKTVVLTNESVTAGTVTASVNATELLGKAYPNVTLFAELKMPECVQLWANGPYFAQCNLGAKKPEEFGYYFWWGDTVGYKRNAAGDGWVSSVDGTTTISFKSSDALAKQTYNKDISALRSGGWIDSSWELVSGHDAATVKLGTPWRMMSITDLQGLMNTTVCKREWKANFNGTGVDGYLVTGIMAGYTNKSIFLPAAGSVSNTTASFFGTRGNYWLSSAQNDSTHSRYLFFTTTDFLVGDIYRYYGFSIRPVRSTK